MSIITKGKYTLYYNLIEKYFTYIFQLFYTYKNNNETFKTPL